MTIEEFNMFVDELDNVCERYGAEIEFVCGKYEPIDVRVHIATVIDEEAE